MLTVIHPEPPPKLSVHVLRVFVEQTFELYSEQKKAWLKLPAEKMRIAEWGHMPNRPNKPTPPSQQPSANPADVIWTLDDTGRGRPGKGAFTATPHVAPYGTAVPHSATGASAPATPGSAPNGHSANPSNAAPAGSPAASAPIPILGNGTGHLSPQAAGKLGYKMRTTLRLPNDDHLRPSTVKGSKAEIRVGHEMGVEVYFSRTDVLDTREGSDTYGKPKIQVFSARRSVVIPSCTATFDTVHLPPYVEESPVNSRPPSPVNLARSPIASRDHPHHTRADLQKLANTLHNTLPGGRGRPTPPHSKLSSHPNSNHNSQPGSRYGSREPSPTRNGFGHERDGVPVRETPSRSHSYGHGLGHSITSAFGSHFPSGMGIGRKSRPNSRPNSRPPSPTHDGPSGGANGSGGSGQGSGSPSVSTTGGIPILHPRSRRGFGGGLHALTPATATQTITAPPSGAATPIHGATTPHHAYSPQTHSTSNMIFAAPGLNASTPSGYVPSTPRTLPANSPWGVSHFPHRTGSSHDTCNCGRTTEELAAAESRLIEGVPTAPGAFSEHHAEGEMPPPWTQSRAPSPDYFSQVWAGTQTVANTPAVGMTLTGAPVETRGTKTPYGSP